MTKQFVPLNEEEFEYLDDDADTQGKDEGVLDISELDSQHMIAKAPGFKIYKMQLHLINKLAVVFRLFTTGSRGRAAGRQYHFL